MFIIYDTWALCHVLSTFSILMFVVHHLLAKRISPGNGPALSGTNINRAFHV